MLVHVGQPEQCLVHDALDLALGKAGLAVLHQLIDVLLHIFKNEVKVVVHADDLLELDNLLMV